MYYTVFARIYFIDESILYVDETVPVYLGTSLEEPTNHVNSRLRIKLDCCERNKISLNPTKSEFMIVTNKRLLACPKCLWAPDLFKEAINFKFI